MSQLWEVQQATGSSASRAGKVKRLRENVALVNLLGENGMTTMQQFYEKVAAMNKDYYALRGEIVSAERRIAALSEHLSMWEQYQEHRAVCKKYTKVKPGKRELFTERHQAELALYGAAEMYLEKLKSGGGEVTPKAWREELSVLAAKKESGYRKMKEMREEVKAVEALKKTADKLAKEQPGQGRKKKEQEL